MSKKEYIVDWNITEETSVKGVSTLVFDDAKISDLAFSLSNKILSISYSGSGSIVKLIDFSKIKYIKTKEVDSDFIITNIIDDKPLIYNIDIYDTPVKNKISTTQYNDTVYLKDFIRYDRNGNPVDDSNKKTPGVKISTFEGKDKITPTQYADTINAGSGFDTIYSSLGNDKITGGKGDNKIVYSDFFDTDTITLSKTENLTIDLSSYDFSSVSDLTFTPTSKNLEIKVEKDGINYGTIILKNFKKSNVVGSKGSVLLDIGLAEPIDLNYDDFLYWDKFSSKGVFNGTRFAETIYAGDIVTPYDNKNKGVTIKAGAGYNTIVGSNGLNDTITGGNDGNDISTYGGENKITTGNGVDKILAQGGVYTIKTAKGNDEITLRDVTSANIFAGAGENKIFIDNSADFGNIVLNEEKLSAVNNIIFLSENISDYYLTRKGNDFIIRSSDDVSALKINSYFLNGKKYAECNFYINTTPVSIDQLALKTRGFVINGKKEILGTNNDDMIIADDYENLSASNDKITSMKGTDTINAGKGANSIYLYNGDGQKTIIDGGGIDTLVFSKGTILSFSYHDDDTLIINYGNENDNILIKNYSVSTSVNYIKIGDVTKKLSDYCAVLSRGGSPINLEISESFPTNLVLANTFSGQNNVYTLKSLSGKRSITLEYLLNGRLYIQSDYIQIVAANNQADDIILLGEHNNLVTGDESDTVRLGYVVDAKGYAYVLQSDNNIVDTGDGDDYITFFGKNNSIDAGNGDDDKVFVIANNADIQSEDISNAEIIRKTTTPLDINYEIGWYNQGEGGGDCRLFALLTSLSCSKDFSLSDYISITDNFDNSYTVTFKNYNHTNNFKTVYLSDLSDFTNVYGDSDVVLADYVMNLLISENKDRNLDTVKKAYYNTIAEYLFGQGEKMTEVGENTGDITVTNYDNPNFNTRLLELWDLYKNGSINNLTVGIQTRSSNYKLGELTAHAYAIKDITDNCITLINPWDSADCLMVEFSRFINLKPCIMVYGIDYYSEHMLVDNGYKTQQNNIMDCYISELFSDTVAWNSNSNLNMFEYEYNDSENKNISQILYPANNSDFT